VASYPVAAAPFPNGVILYSAFSVAAVSPRVPRRFGVLPPWGGRRAVEEVVDVTSNFRKPPGARMTESSAVSDINDLDLPAPCTADGEGGVQDSARQRARRAATGRLDTFWRGAIMEPTKSSVSSLRGKTP
jgi:hypothetical protein